MKIKNNVYYVIAFVVAILIIFYLAIHYFYLKNDLSETAETAETAGISVIENIESIGGFVLSYQQLIELGLNQELFQENDFSYEKTSLLVSDNFIVKNKSNLDNVIIITVRSTATREQAEWAFNNESAAYANKYSLIDKTQFYKLDDRSIKFFESPDGNGVQGYFFYSSDNAAFQYRVFVKNKYFKKSFESFKNIAILISPDLANKFLSK